MSRNEGTSDEDIKYASQVTCAQNPPLVAATLVSSVSNENDVVHVREEQQITLSESIPVATIELPSSAVHVDYSRGVSTMTAEDVAPGDDGDMTSTQRASSVGRTMPSPRAPLNEEEEPHYFQEQNIPHQIVHIDHDDDLETADSSRTGDEARQQGKGRAAADQLRKCSQVYVLIASVIFFISAVIAIVVTILVVRHRSTDKPLVGPTTINAPVPSLPAPSNLLLQPTPAPVSQVPSQAPSCTGLFSRTEETENIAASAGAHLFAIDHDGSTIVAAKYDYGAGKSRLETFLYDQHFTSPEAYSILDLQVNGNGDHLILGVDSYPQDGLGINQTLGGAVLMFRGNDTSWWQPRPHTLLVGGGPRGKVNSVSISDSGRTIAFVTNNRWIEVYNMNGAEHEEWPMTRLGGRIEDSRLFDSNTRVRLSGNGHRLFVSTGTRVIAYDLDDEDNEWVAVGQPILHEAPPEVYSSHDGNVVLLGSSFDVPLAVHELVFSSGAAGAMGNATPLSATWQKVSSLDISSQSMVQKMAMSSDARNVFMLETWDSGNVARLFHRSGSTFLPLQDMSLDDGLVRGLVLDYAGEQLVVAIDETVTTYRKDCASGRMLVNPAQDGF